MVCRQLGYLGAASFNCCSAYGPVPSTFAFDNVVCDGQETAISACQYFDVDDCGTDEGIGVICNPGTQISANI